MNTSVSLYLQYEWWELYEAAYILTRWPPCLHAWGIPYSVLGKVGERGSILGWGGPGRFNSKILGNQFRRVFADLKKAIANGEITEIRAAYLPGYAGSTVSFIPSWEVITWALLKGLIFPDALSQELGLYQIQDTKIKKNSHRKIKNQIIGQFLLENDKALSVTSICNHELMEKFGSWKDPAVSERKAMRRAINELFQSKGEPGVRSRRGEKQKLRSYMSKAISLVYKKDPNGVVRYHFSLLRIAIDTAIDIKIFLMGQSKFYRMTEPEFIKWFIVDPVVNLYIKESSVNSVRFITYLILEKIRKYYAHPKICAIPLDIRKDMTIGQLVEKNREFLFGRLSEEEKKQVKFELKLDFFP